MTGFTPPRQHLPSGATDPNSGRTWWQRKFLSFPISIWIIAAASLVMAYVLFSVISGLFSSDSEKAESPTPTPTLAPQGLDIPAAGASAGAGTVTDSAAGTVGGSDPEPVGGVPIPATPTIEGCVIATPNDVTTISLGLSPGIELGLAYSGTDALGRVMVSGATYQSDDGLRLSDNATWMLDNGVIYAMDGAIDVSSFPDTTTLTDPPDLAAVPTSCVASAIAQTGG